MRESSFQVKICCNKNHSIPEAKFTKTSGPVIKWKHTKYVPNHKSDDNTGTGHTVASRVKIGLHFYPTKRTKCYQTETKHTKQTCKAASILHANVRLNTYYNMILFTFFVIWKDLLLSKMYRIWLKFFNQIQAATKMQNYLLKLHNIK